MKKFKVITNYADLSTPHLIELGRNSVSKMSVYPQIFQQPDITYTTMLNAATNLENKYNLAQEGSKLQIIDLKMERALFHRYIRLQALYVDRIADGNELTISRSGFQVSKQASTTSRPDFIVENDNHAGVVNLQHKAITGMKSWIWQYSIDEDDESKWILAGASTQASFTIKDLTPGVRYWFRVAGVRPTGQNDWCEAISQIVT